jgi:hypothetical protein
MAVEKHFVDTSVMRPLISSSSAVKNYYLKELSESLYYCSYIRMEFIRGFIVPAISFYFTLRMPTILSISDAISLWSQKFQPRELKTILSMISGLLEGHQFDFNDLKEKEKSCQIVADYIRRIMTIIPKKFKDIGIETNMCFKSNLKIDFNPDSLDKTFREFIDSFHANKVKDCNIHVFIEKNNSQIEKIIDKRGLQIEDSNPEGFTEIVDELSSGIKNSCKYCSKIGDLIIALISPSDMRLEHTDNSFDYLMLILNKKHKKHPSEVYLNKLS